MIVLVIVASAAIGAGVTHLAHLRANHAEVGRLNDVVGYLHDVTDRLVDELEDVKAEAGRQIGILRSTVIEQAVIVRRTLGRPQKRRVPAGAPS